MIFDADSEFSSPMSPSVTCLWRPGRHLTQNWSKMMRNEDPQNHVLTTQGMSRSHQGHARPFPDVVRSTLLLGTNVKIRAPLQYPDPVTLWPRFSYVESRPNSDLRV